MLLSDLLKKIKYESLSGPKDDIMIDSICRDSRIVSDGSLFVCIKGAVSDGHDFARAAYGKGARAFLAERPLDLPDDAAIIIVDDTRIGLAQCSEEFYGHPQREIFVVGITGTKGKTTTALAAYGILNSAGISTGYIGSNGIRFSTYKYHTANTTPESCDIFKYMRLMADAGVKCLVMEVSSQAIYMNRIHGIKFDVCCFTNLYVDHIGGAEHPTFEHYRDSKRALFTDFGAKTIVYNADDSYAEYMVGDSDAKKISVSLNDTSANLYASDIELLTGASSLSVSFETHFERDKTKTSISMPGRFSVYNGLMALAVCRAAGLSIFAAAKIMPTISVDGRFETVNAIDGVSFVIDYAHNGASLEASLKALRDCSPKRLICLFGSVGGRTFNRRRELGTVAAALSDLCIITSDNPDFEPPERVIDEIALCFNKPDSCPYIKITDRRDAIRYAVKHAKKGDIILLAGKGHEEYQLINGQQVPFSERAIILEAAEELIKIN